MGTDRNHVVKLKTAADPVRVADALGLRGRGKRYFCPACQPDGGKTPDLAVRAEYFKCHKCGLKGDLLKLVQIAGGLDFPSAVRWLEDLTGVRPVGKGVAVSGVDKRKTGTPTPALKSRVLKPLEVARPVKKAGPDPTIYAAFLDACRPVEGPALDFLVEEKGVKPEVVDLCRLRFCGKEYLDVIKTLTDRFGEDALLIAGLVKPSKTGRLVPSFWHYFAKKTGFLVIPYFKDGRPVYLKARPPLLKEKAEGLGLVRFLNTSTEIPCLYNADCLIADPPLDKVLVCEGESDTWTALSYGFAAVGSPGAKNFKDTWVEDFRRFTVATGIDEERAAIREYDGGLSRAEAEAAARTGQRSTVYLVLDADKAGADGERIIADLFLKAGLPIPRKLAIPDGKDLTDFMKEGITA